MSEAPATNSDPLSAMDPGMAANPRPMFKLMRDESPVTMVEGVGAILSRRADIDQVFRHPEVFSSMVDAVDLKNIRPLIPLQIDPPDHKKFRKLLDPIFAPRQMALLEDDVTSLVNELIDGFIDDGEVDFAARFSVPFPSRVFLTLLGLPFEELPRFLQMKDGIIRPHIAISEAWNSEPAHAYQRQMATAIYDYFTEVLELREHQREDDLLSRFLDAEVDGERLTREDILDICFLFLIAGLDTVTASLDCMFGYFATHPAQRQRIVDDPSVIPAAVEELLRWETPVMGVARVCAEDVEVGGCPIRKGEKVMVMLGSANTDERAVAGAGEVQLDRAVNKHLAFGGGVHRCLGSHLARLELRVAVREWHRRIPEYAVAPGHTLQYTPSIRSIDHFPMVLGATGA